MKNALNQQKGFTIIELVVVMVVIGVLSAVALPRLFDLAGQARQSAVISITSSLKTAGELAHTQWIAAGQPTSVAVGDTVFFTGTQGYPLNVTVAASPAGLTSVVAQDCIDLWNALLKNPPIASADTDCLALNTCKFKVTVAASTCTFTDKGNNEITYDTTNGNVTSTVDTVY